MCIIPLLQTFSYLASDKLFVYTAVIFDRLETTTIYSVGHAKTIIATCVGKWLGAAPSILVPRVASSTLLDKFQPFFGASEVSLQLKVFRRVNTSFSVCSSDRRPREKSMFSCNFDIFDYNFIFSI